MGGKVFAALKLSLLPALLLGAGLAAAEDAPAPAPSPDRPAAVIVLDGSKSMSGKLGETAKLDMARGALEDVIASQADRLSLGLVAYGHRKESNCADSEIMAKPGALDGGGYAKLLGTIQAKGQAPIAAAISDAASLADSDQPLDVVLVASGGDTCDADVCVTADALKQKTKGLRIHVVGLSDKSEDVQPLACVAAATGGKFVAAASETDLKAGLNSVFAAIATRAPPMAAAPPVNAPPEHQAAQQLGETAILKSGAPQAQRVIPVSPAPPKTQPVRPVPVSFRALLTEEGPKLQSGLIWRVYSAKAKADGGFELISTHREPSPTAALLPGEYLVNVAYGLSNLTKKVEVEGGKSEEETFVLNTGGLALRAVLASGEECPDGSIRFDIQSDEQDQFGNRETILADAHGHRVIRLNAGAYHVRSLYGDANASVGVDVTVEPGRVTEATIKHTGAKITFRLVQNLGGEALANTKWTILTSAGDTVKSNAGALPTHILAAGSYAVVADHDGKSYTRKFAIEPGSDKQIEVAISDGPTSPEELKALLDPPEPPPPGTGGLAGEGPGGAVGFDSFSRPADPNAPLINPGALFRPSAP
jgi:von Willebrand factor type A domain